jgi:uncharacterized membrane protein
VLSWAQKDLKRARNINKSAAAAAAAAVVEMTGSLFTAGRSLTISLTTGQLQQRCGTRVEVGGFGSLSIILNMFLVILAWFLQRFARECAGAEDAGSASPLPLPLVSLFFWFWGRVAMLHRFDCCLRFFHLWQQV